MKKIWCLGWVLAGLAVASCSSEDADERQDPVSPGVERRQAVEIVTRAAGEDGDGSGLQAGLYMVNYDNGQQTSLLSADNYVNNLLMNYSDGLWQPTSAIYWQDTNVNADFYAYAPFAEQVDDARAMAFAVATDQTPDEAFEKSDLLWGTAQNQSPLDGGITLMLNHQLSQLTVVVTGGAGFSEGELLGSDVSVAIGGSKTLGTFDLQTGVMSAVGGTADVKCHNDGGLTFTAILLPQQIPFANLIQIDWKGSKYTVQNSFKLEAKRHYTITVQLKKTQGGLDVGIDGWDIIDEDFGGVIGG